MNHTSPRPEWSHLVRAETITPKAQSFTLSPDAATTAKLCERLELLSLENCVAKLTAQRLPSGHTIKVTGMVTADIAQACVATLEPVPAHVDSEVLAHFQDATQTVSFDMARKKRGFKEQDETLLEREMPDDADEPEPIVNGQIDLGELVTQFLSLALPLYPRVADAEEKLAALLAKQPSSAKK